MATDTQTFPSPDTTRPAAMTAEQRTRFDRDGYLVIPRALNGAEVEVARRALTGAYRDAERNGRLDAHRALHELSAVARRPELAFLLDHPRTFGHVWSTLGWNVHVYHSHLDVHPRRDQPGAPFWGWHQDGGRQNREVETTPRPRLSVKVAYWLSDVSEPGRGNLMVVPGSHRTNWLPGPPRRDVPWEQPADAVPLLVEAGDAVFFDRRLWHCRSDNASAITRMAVFFGYTYRWVVGRDEIGAGHRTQPWWHALTDVQRQLLGGAGDESGDHRWGHHPHDVPLYLRLRALGALDPGFPPLIPDAADAR